jgi:hypothetical protein
LATCEPNKVQRQEKFVELNKGELIGSPMGFDLDALDSDGILEDDTSSKNDKDIPLLVCAPLTLNVDKADAYN